VAGGAEARARGGVVCAWLVGFNGCPALRRECEPGIRLAVGRDSFPRRREPFLALFACCLFKKLQHIGGKLLRVAMEFGGFLPRTRAGVCSS